MAMRRVTDQEHASRAELGRQHPFQGPAGDLVDGHRQVGNAEGQAHVRFDLRVGEILRAFALVGDVEDPLFAVRAPMVRPHRHQHRHLGDRGTPDPADQHVRIRRQLRQIGGDMRGRGLGQHPQAFVGDPDQPGNGATAVAAEHVAGPHRVLGARVVVRDPGADAVAVLLEPGQLMVEPDPTRIELFGTRLQDRLETNLRKVGATAGAGLHPVEIVVPAAPGLDLRDQPAEVGVRSGEAGIPAHRAHVLGGRALLIDGLSDPDVAEYLHGPLVQHVRLR